MVSRLGCKRARLLGLIATRRKDRKFEVKMLQTMRGM